MAIPTISDADAFHELRQTAAWLAVTVDDDAKTAALYKAQDYILATYVFADDTETDNPLIQNAIIMLAPDMLGASSVSATALVTYERKKMDGLGEFETHYSEKAPVVDRFPLITASLRSLLAPVEVTPSAVSGRLAL